MTGAGNPGGKSLLAQAFSIASGTALGQLALIAVTPLLTRLYSTESFGTFGIFTAFITVTSLFVTFRLDMAIPSAANDSDANRLLRITLAVVGPASLASAPLILFMDFGEHSLGGCGELVLMALAGAATAVAGWFSALRYWHVRHLHFPQIGRGVATQGVARAASPVALSYVFPSWVGLALGDTLGRLFGMFSMGRDAQRTIRAQREDPSAQPPLREFLSGYRRFPLLLMPSSVLDAIAVNLPVIVVAKLFGLVAAGEYALVVRVAAAPSALIGNAIGDVFHGRLTERLRTAPQDARAELRHAALRLALFGALIYLPAALLAPWLFPLVFGAEWEHAGRVFALMTPYLFAGFVVSPLSRALLATNRMELKLIADALFLVLPMLCLFLARDASFDRALLIFSCAQALVFACYAALIARAVALPRS